MTPDEIKTIRKSFAILEGRPEALATLFYNRLFRLDPSLRSMFRTDIKDQAKKLTDVLVVLVGSLERLETLRPTLQHMGSRHAEYGVRPEHYRTVGQALLAALEEIAGPRFDAAMKHAWTKVLTLVSNEMMQGAADTPTLALGAGTLLASE